MRCSASAANPFTFHGAQDVAESEAMLPHLLEMFGEHAEFSPEWDRERK